MRKFFVFIIIIFINFQLYSQVDNDDDFEKIDWKYLFLDLGYGTNGPGGALGFRYWNLGASIGVTGFASDIPQTTVIYPGDNINIGDLPTKKYPSNVVYGDLIAFYDINLDYTIFAGIGFYSAIDSVLAYREIQGINAYYKKGAETHSGITFSIGAQTSLYFLDEENPALDQLVAGVGYHTKLGIFLRLAYRWE